MGERGDRPQPVTTTYEGRNVTLTADGELFAIQVAEEETIKHFKVWHPAFPPRVVEGVFALKDPSGSESVLFPFALPTASGYVYKPSLLDQFPVPASTTLVVRLSLGFDEPSLREGWSFELAFIP